MHRGIAIGATGSRLRDRVPRFFEQVAQDSDRG